MGKLEDFDHVRENLKSAKKATISVLHKLIFHNDGDRKNRQRLRNFEGFTFTNTDAEYSAKVDYIKTNFDLPDLITICHTLGIQYRNENLPEHILQNLLNNSLLTSVAEDDAEDDPEDDSEDDAEDDPEDDANEDNYGSQQLDNVCNDFQRMPSFSMNFRDVEESLNVFDGSDNLTVETWVKEFEETATIFHWDDFQKFVFAKKLLRGIAALFVKSERNLTSWPKLKHALLSEFKTVVNSASIHQQLNKRKIRKEENMQEYFLHMKELAARGNLEDSALIQYVINGITDSNSNKVILYGAKNLKDFKNKLKLYEMVRGNKQSQDSQKTMQDQGINHKKVAVDSKARRCYNCGRTGHKSSDCKNKEQGVKCFNCNMFGHYAKNCEKPKTEPKANTRCVAITNDVMMINVNINKVSVKALFDTGSKFNLLSEKIYRQLEGISLVPTFVQLTGFGDKRHENRVNPTGKIKCNIEVDGQIFDINLIVVPNEFMDVEMIIGKEFCANKEIKIDHKGVHFLQDVKNYDDMAPEIMKIDCFTTDEVDIDYSAITLQLLIKEKEQLIKEAAKYRILNQEQQSEVQRVAIELENSKERFNNLQKLFFAQESTIEQLQKQNEEMQRKLEHSQVNRYTELENLEGLQNQIKCIDSYSTEQVNKLIEENHKVEMAEIRTQQLSNESSISDGNRIETLMQMQLIHEQQIRDLQAIVQSITQEKEQANVQYQNYVQQLNVEIVQQYINSTMSRSTNYTPFELLTGVKMRLKEDPKIKQVVEAEMIHQFSADREQLRLLAKENILKAQQENKRRYNTRRKPASKYKEGDLVAVKRTQFGGGLKLKAKYLGPYQIVKCKPKNSYDVIRVGAGEGPMRTSSCAEYIKPWPDDYELDGYTFEANDGSG